MNTEDLPLLDLFERLRQADLPLGIGEYQTLLRALQGGFGMASREELRRLCCLIWAKSTAEVHLISWHFDQIMTMRATRAPGSQDPSPDPRQTKPTEARAQPNQSSPGGTAKKDPAMPVETAAVLPPPVLQEDEVPSRKAALRRRIGEHPASSRLRFALFTDYLPVSERQMKQSWRQLRRTHRQGPAVELDIQATIREINRQGLLLSPILVPLRVNLVELIFLIDQEGSMIPFHSLVNRLVETATRGGRLRQVQVFYFHNYPGFHLYHDPERCSALPLEGFLSTLRPERTAVLIVSDAGAARASFNSDRVDATSLFLVKLKERVRRLAWLNPMPSARWPMTSAEEIARHIPMFEVNRQGLEHALDTLRGRPMITDLKPRSKEP